MLVEVAGMNTYIIHSGTLQGFVAEISTSLMNHELRSHNSGRIDTKMNGVTTLSFVVWWWNRLSIYQISIVSTGICIYSHIIFTTYVVQLIWHFRSNIKYC